MQLTTQNVQSILMDCLFKDGEDTSNAITAEAVRLKLGFHPQRIGAQRENILSLLKELPVDFMQTGGGGSSFLNACMTESGEQWGEHENIDELICLGLAVDLVKFPMPRDMWSILPGGMPYLTVVDK